MHKGIIIIIVGTIILVIYEAFRQVQSNATTTAGLAEQTGEALANLVDYNTPALGSTQNLALQNAGIDSQLLAFDNPLLTSAQSAAIGDQLDEEGFTGFQGF